ncbi:MAG TPA: hypothetical protein VMF89_22570 [Polyangiales bacterium]|nr:hypothetical protein [Polyangiales bacterium]
MTFRNVVFSVALVGLACSKAAAQDGMVFTLSDVDSATQAPVQDLAIDPKLAIKQSLGALQWGMSKSDLIKLLKAQIRAEFDQRIKVERDIMRQDAIYQEFKERAQRLGENYVAFEGAKTGWDVSPIASEFSRDNREAMLVVTGKGTRDMYFFIQGKLWKWYREIDRDAADATSSAEALKRRFGAGKPQKSRRDESNAPFAGTTWSDESTRVTALRRGAETCLIFEDMSTLENLEKLRFHAQGASNKSSEKVIDLIMLTDAERKERGL